MRNLTYIALVLLAVTPTLAQSWQHTTKNDELHAKTVETFTLTGKYLTPPRSVPADLAPSMVVTCTAGKVTQNYFTFGAVIDRNTSSIYPVMMESRIDGKSFNIAGDSVSTDGTAVFFTRVDLGESVAAPHAHRWSQRMPVIKQSLQH